MTKHLIPNSDGTKSKYQDDPAKVRLRMGDFHNFTDFQMANPGQWFYGVVETKSGQVCWVPGDVHDDPANAQQRNARMLNTYASKPKVPDRGWKSLTSQNEKMNGIGSTPTGHQAVIRHYGLDSGSCLGFRIIKIDESIISYSDRSNSLNGNKTDARVAVVLPFGTPPESIPNSPGYDARNTYIIAGPGGWKPSSTVRMPPQWSRAIQLYLRSTLGVEKIAADF